MTPWTVAYQVPQSMEFSRQEYWSRLPYPSPEDLPDPGIEPGSAALQADAVPSEPPGSHWDLPGSGLKHASPALAGGPLSPEPPGKCSIILFNTIKHGTYSLSTFPSPQIHLVMM